MSPGRATLRMCVLASGSSGNCTVVRFGGGTVLIDAGIGPRMAGVRLTGTGVGVRDVSDILLTHLDSDHFKATWFRTILSQGIRVHVARQHLHAFYRTDDAGARTVHRAGLLSVFDDSPIELGGMGVGAARVHTLRCPHDEAGSVSFRFETAQGRLAFATDLGHTTRELVDSMADVELLAIESNYDPVMQAESLRPEFLKQRIMGGYGHLSNGQAREAVVSAVEKSAQPPRHIVLLHLSRQCNHPEVVERAWADVPHLASRLCVTSQERRTDWMEAGESVRPMTAEQLAMW